MITNTLEFYKQTWDDHAGNGFYTKSFCGGLIEA